MLKSVDEPLFKIKPRQELDDPPQKTQSVGIAVDDSPRAAKRLRFGDNAAVQNHDLTSPDQAMADDATPSPKSNPSQVSPGSVLRRSSKIAVRVEGRVDSEPKILRKKKKKRQVNFA